MKPEWKPGMKVLRDDGVTAVIRKVYKNGNITLQKGDRRMTYRISEDGLSARSLGSGHDLYWPTKEAIGRSILIRFKREAEIKVSILQSLLDRGEFDGNIHALAGIVMTVAELIDRRKEEN